MAARVEFFPSLTERPFGFDIGDTEEWALSARITNFPTGVIGQDQSGVERMIGLPEGYVSVGLEKSQVVHPKGQILLSEAFVRGHLRSFMIKGT